MRRLASFALLLFAACVTEPTSDLALATESDADVLDGKADGSWMDAATLHVGERVRGHAELGGRQVYPVWLDRGLAIDVVARAIDDASVRVAVLGPLHGTKRDVIAAAGYGTPRANIEMTIETPEAGEYLVVVGSHALASATTFELATFCPACRGPETDVLATPKAGALVGTGGTLAMELGRVLAERAFDLEVEVWASPPGQGKAINVATATASGNQVNVILPATVQPADDLTLVVREAGGRILETGVGVRFAPVLTTIVRTDALSYDAGGVSASGIAGAFEGVIELALRREADATILAEAAAHGDRPGQVGNGYAAFDVRFVPTQPQGGELLSIGQLDGNGDYRRLACFAYCADPASCTGGPRACE